MDRATDVRDLQPIRNGGIHGSDASRTAVTADSVRGDLFGVGWL